MNYIIQVRVIILIQSITQVYRVCYLKVLSTILVTINNVVNLEAPRTDRLADRLCQKISGKATGFLWCKKAKKVLAELHINQDAITDGSNC